MCTVTIVPKGDNNFILTSNRDEASHRTSLAPNLYGIDGVNALFPKDELSGGTWIGVSAKKRVVCVLNGGFIPHNRKSSYRLSRGVLAKHFLVADAIEDTLEHYNYNNIEPFTCVIADWNTKLKFIELVWDGNQKHISHLPLQPKIWSSTTLYDTSMIAERETWFEEFKSEQELNAKTLLEFHQSAGKGNLNYGVIMDRGFVKTTSITQIYKQDKEAVMHYNNLLKEEQLLNTFKFPQTVNG